MKKTYIAPEATEYIVSVQQIIANSLTVGGNATDEDGVDTKEDKGTGIWDLY